MRKKSEEGEREKNHLLAAILLVIFLILAIQIISGAMHVGA
jgi:hypothetical protein